MSRTSIMSLAQIARSRKVVARQTRAKQFTALATDPSCPDLPDDLLSAIEREQVDADQALDAFMVSLGATAPKQVDGLDWDTGKVTWNVDEPDGQPGEPDNATAPNGIQQHGADTGSGDAGSAAGVEHGLGSAAAGEVGQG